MDGSSCRLVRAFFFNDTATTEISTLSLHDALPISGRELQGRLLYKGHVLDGDLREHYRNVLRTACHQLQSSVLPILTLSFESLISMRPPSGISRGSSPSKVSSASRCTSVSSAT